MKQILSFWLLLVSTWAYSQAASNSNSLEELNSLIRVEPSAENFYLRGYFHYNEKHYEKAMEDYTTSIRLDADNFKAYFSRGMLKDKMRDYIGAIDDYSICISLNNTSAKAFFNRGFSRSNTLDITGAIEDYSTCIELAPEHKAAFLNRGILRKNQNQFEKALLDYDHAIAIDSDFLDAVQSRAVLKALMNRKDAIQDFNTAIRIAPDDGETYYNRAVYIINNKIDQDYCADIRKALKLGFAPANSLFAKKCSKYNPKTPKL